jgi:hypothetical protein
MHLLARRFYSNCVYLLYYGCSAELIHIHSAVWESNLTSTVQLSRFFFLAYVLGYSCLLISQTADCASGVFRESLCVFSYIIVCRFVVGVGWGGVGSVSSVSFCK